MANLLKIYTLDDLNAAKTAGAWPLAFGVYNMLTSDGKTQVVASNPPPTADNEKVMVDNLQMSWAGAEAKLVEGLKSGLKFEFTQTAALVPKEVLEGPPIVEVSTTPTWVPWAVGAAVLFFLFKKNKGESK